LAKVKKVLPELGMSRENTVFISGIGCSSRFPYYMNTYGFHTIHGRAPTIATGLKITRPDLHVWVITGDGDGLSIGTNHLLHLMRRNIKVTILLFNNQIYGLTKGQYSPTSEKGKKTKTTPEGSIDEPFSPVTLALAAGCSFVARALDVDSQGLPKILKAAAQHPGTAFVEIYQNCNVFNDGTFSHISEKVLRAERTLMLSPDQPCVFGENNNKGLVWNGSQFTVIPLLSESDKQSVHLHKSDNSVATAIALNSLQYPDFPVPLGIFRAVHRPIYEAILAEKRELAEKTQPFPSLTALLHTGKTWVIK